MALFQAGELRRAVLAFEAEVQRAPDNAEAWRMLGTWSAFFIPFCLLIVLSFSMLLQLSTTFLHVLIFLPLFPPFPSPPLLLPGMTHAENDEDKRAISCLERAVDHDPHSLPALLALGVSYVNELDSVRALQNLKAWVEHNPKYQVRPPPFLPPSLPPCIPLSLPNSPHSSKRLRRTAARLTVR
jgi:peroxin-5